MSLARQARKPQTATVGLLHRCATGLDDLLWLKQGRCPMVEIIGLVTMGALVWLIAWSMGRESESEKRRMSTPHETGRSTEVGGARSRHAA